ncbi:hypothetical protein HOP50_06g43810 [Chloropicon primus]|uniref:DUF8003 domain-containing protein n=1 Tax=Chloropicon primus TaxID=1764295 RepID=A0A5B8MR22_9CHLO|nr:hypothetical protein A3770_06p43580 [Chloropicon primus]UPR01060.1 hypothetical protein HOP50_06g43810 [Chloropicon primus]|eukprot:QDZ21840.1 hypothetical protein A3770_06p43580 [Chloropicon primus]
MPTLVTALVVAVLFVGHNLVVAGTPIPPRVLEDKFTTECRTLGGTGSLTTECVVSESKQWERSDVVSVSGPGNITVKENVTLTVDGETSSSFSGGFNITIGGIFTLEPGAVLRGPTIVLTTNELNVHPRAAVNASGLGSSAQGLPFDKTFGAGYGGTGAACTSDAKARDKGKTYGWKYNFEGVTFPFSQEGGGSSSVGNGGGRIYIQTKGNITLAGAIESNGLGSYQRHHPGGGGSGGSITIDSVGIINNSSDYCALISASGGPGTETPSSDPAGGGGGGRISVKCRQFDSSVRLQASGGLSSENCTIGGSVNNGGAGTIFLSENDVDQLHISNNGRGVERITTTEVTCLGVFNEQQTLDKFILQYEAVAEMSSSLTLTQVIARQVELTSSSSLMFGSSSTCMYGDDIIQRKKPDDGMLVGLVIKADSFSMSNSVMDVHAGHLQYGGLYTTAGSFNLSDSSVVTIVADTSSNQATVSKILGSVSITSGSSLISDGKLFLTPFYESEAIVQIGSGMDEADQQNIIAGSYITFVGYKNVSVAQNSQVLAPCSPSVSKACAAFNPCSQFGATCPKQESPCQENTKGFWTVSFCKISDMLHIAGGLVTGSNIYVVDTPAVSVTDDGAILASSGCPPGAGPGNGTGNSINGAGGGAGHGGDGGNGTFGDQTAAGGLSYGSKGRPCENGSGGGSGEQPGGKGGGSILMGSKQNPMDEIYLDGKISANGENAVSSNAYSAGGGGGGGSGGSILFYATSFSSAKASIITARGGNATYYGGGGGGGGGRVHFDWTVDNGDVGNRPIRRIPAIIPCNVSVDGGEGSKNGSSGWHGTETTISCPVGRTGVFCAFCPLGTYKDSEGPGPCKPCQAIPRKANYSVAIGGTQYPCAYGCYTYNLESDCALPNALLSFIERAFGGELQFIGIFWGCILMTALISGWIKSGLRGRDSKIKKFGNKWHTPIYVTDNLPTASPLLESLDEVLTNDETASHTNYEDFTLRIHFQGSGSVHDPWKLSEIPPPELKKNMIIESEYLNFVDNCNRITMSEGIDQLGTFGILKLLCPPIAWKWKNRHRKVVLENLQYFIESEEGHSFLRSARSRALLDVLTFGHSQDLTLAYFDLHVTIHEMQSSIKNARNMKGSNEEILHSKLPMTIMFAGEGSFLSPYNVQLPASDFLQQFLCETLSPLIWAKLVASLNMQLQNTLRSTLEDDVDRLQAFVRKKFESYLASFDMKASLYVSNLHLDTCQIGLMIDSLVKEPASVARTELDDTSFLIPEHRQAPKLRRAKAFRRVKLVSAVKKILFCAHVSFRGPRMQATLGLVIFLLVSLDGCITIYMLIEIFALQEIFIFSLLIPPLAILASPFNGMFELLLGRRKNMALTVRLHNTWNMCSMISVLVVLFGESIRTVLYADNFDHISWYHSQSTYFFMVPLFLLIEKVLQILLVNVFAASIASATSVLNNN